jgi:hypothetical protein
VAIVTVVIGREQIEQIELSDNLKDFYVSLPKAINKDNEIQKIQPDVLGQPAEPICTYYGCSHKFSLHGSRKCRYKHPTNKTLGIQVRYL